ncbi:hypothetical protein BDZ45DRAFT_681239 [Acephala macrosclerotiorum]|nr:hypothetical protein BDZ45DRAFT_681239 [Acephala macrosclerotiorum]
MYPKRILHIRLLPVFLTFSFGLIAFIFSLLAVTSKDWAVRNNYDPLYTPKNWTSENVIYTLYRSPFIICSASSKVTDLNSTNSTSDSGAPRSATTYTVSCQKFKPFGFDRTSCEEEVATQDDTATNLGDTRLCQQIHYAANFGITSTVFISLSFILISMVTIATLAVLLRSSETDDGVDAESRKPQERRPEGGDEFVEVDLQQSSASKRREKESHGRHQRSVLLPYLNLTLLVFITIAVITALISQFYAVEGLIQSVYNNADFSTSQGASSAEIQVSGTHGPWFQGKALSVYATCAWGFAAAAAAVAVKAWRLPQWDTVI